MNFNSIFQLLDHFKDDIICKDHLAKVRWSGNPCCPHCASSNAWVTNRGYKCSDCLKKFSVITGTVFENTKVSLRYWYAAIYYATAHKKGISSAQLARDLGLTQKTTWFMLHRIREMLKDKSGSLMTGIIQADEAYVGGELRNKHESKRREIENGQGRGKDKAPIIALISKDGEARVFSTEDVSGMTIFNILHKNVQKGETLVTDGFQSYNFPGRLYNHIKVKHTDGTGKPSYKVTGKHHTNGVENFFSRLKWVLEGSYICVSLKHLQRYCDEYAMRFSLRDISDSERFGIALSRSMGRRLRYVDLVGKKAAA